MGGFHRFGDSNLQSVSINTSRRKHLSQSLKRRVCPRGTDAIVFAQDTLVYNHCHIYFLLGKLHGVKSKLENHLEYQ